VLTKRHVIPPLLVVAHYTVVAVAVEVENNAAR
jgi:hypothetical protein